MQIKIFLGGKERSLKFNQYAIEQFYGRISWTNYVESSEVYAMFFAGLLGACYVKGEEPDFTFEDVCDWVDELYSTEDGEKVIKQASQTMADTKQYKRALEKMKERIRAMSPNKEEPKKKVVKKNTRSTASKSTK